MLTSFQETTVPLAVWNTGRLGWDPSRVHLSYHWLWLIPRELASRSRLLPYQEGIRTELPGVVAPGGIAMLRGRLLAPAAPGLYWLQWDMVEEGVTWFVQVSPRPERRLIVVLPTPAQVLAPLPLLVTVAALLVLEVGGRRRLPRRLVAFAETSDVRWCIASLVSKPLILIHEALLEPTAVAYWLIVVTAIVPPVVALVALPRRARIWTLFGLGIFTSLLLLGDVIYYRFFGDVLSAPAVLAARQTGQVWGTVRSLLTPGLVWLVLDWPFALGLAYKLSRHPLAVATTRRHRTVVAAACVTALTAAGGVVSAPHVLASTPLDQMFRNRAVVELLGPLGYHAYDAWNYVRGTWLRAAATPAQIAEADAWFAARASGRAGGPAFGAARGKNLVVIQVESLQDFVVDYRIDGQDVMPHLRRWTADSLRFTNVTDQTAEGRTSDAEFLALTSLLPVDHGAVAFRYPGNHYVALPRVLVERGYSTLSAVAFEAGFWNRRVMHPSYGFQQSLFEPDFELTEQIGWGLNDRDFLQQMVPRLEKAQQPFAAWLITLSLHHPYEGFPSGHKVLKLGALEGTAFGNYLHTMRFFDQALEDFRNALARDGLLDRSVLVVFGDHDAGFVRDPALSASIGISDSPVAWELNDRIPLFVRVPGLFAARPGLPAVHQLPAGQSDFAPTLLALLGIDPSRLPYTGRNLLGDPDDPPVVRPYGDWIDRSHAFVSRGSTDRATVCYDRKSAAPVDEGACEGANRAARAARDISRLVIVNDLQQRLREQ